MPEHPAFDFSQIHGRSMVRLRVRPEAAEAACQALDLPQKAMESRSGDPAAYWIGPDKWLLTSDTVSAEEISAPVKSALAGQLHAATDLSSQCACFELKGPAARLVLAMACGIDMHTNAFAAGQCVRTHFANVPLLIAAEQVHHFDLYLDRSFTRYLADWFASAGDDPMTRDSEYHKITGS